jgi:hypothetical protein
MSIKVRTKNGSQEGKLYSQRDLSEHDVIQDEVELKENLASKIILLVRLYNRIRK